MKRSLRRLSFFALAVVLGAGAFGLFWSANVQAYSSGGTYCPGVTSSGPNVDMCYLPGQPNQTTVKSVPPATQSVYLGSGKYKCGACPTSGV